MSKVEASVTRLQSVAILVVRAQDALRRGDVNEAQSLMSDAEDDLKAASRLAEEIEETAIPFSRDEILAMRKCEAATRFTAYPGEVGRDVYRALESKGILRFSNGWRLTEKGTEALKSCG